jgi:hypothetical protein
VTRALFLVQGLFETMLHPQLFNGAVAASLSSRSCISRLDPVRRMDGYHHAKGHRRSLRDIAREFAGDGLQQQTGPAVFGVWINSMVEGPTPSAIALNARRNGVPAA